MTIESPPRPSQPEDLDALIEEARRRARRRRWGVLLILAALGAILYLIVGHGGGGGGSASRAGPSPGGSGSAQRSSASSSSPTGTSCTVARTTGDFDGDGTPDVARLAALASPGQSCARILAPTRYLLRVSFGSGGKLDQRLRRCGDGPCAGGGIGQPFAATDLNGDGRSELAVGVGPGTAIAFVEFFRVARRTIRPLRIAPASKAKAHLRPGPAILGGGFDSGGISPVACLVKPDGGRVLASIQAAPIGSSLDGPWRVHRADLALRGETLHVVQVSTTTTAHGFYSHGFRFHGPWPQFQVACP
jgi:hypothetical protein